MCPASINEKNEHDEYVERYEIASPYWANRARMICRVAKLLTTGQAADELGISRQTLAKWWADGVVKPRFTTAGGHARWDVEDLRRQIEEWRRREDDE